LSPARVKTANYILQLVLLITLICVFVPFLPGMPRGDLDPSWSFGMNQAVAQGLIFGKEMVFSFGPYASIYTGLYHPATDSLMLFGSIYLALSYWFALFVVARDGRKGLLLALALMLACLMYSRDALLFSYPLLAGLHCYLRADSKLESRRDLGVIALVFAPLGLLSLIKGSLLVLCGAIGGLAFILLASHRRFRSATVAVSSAMLTMLACWAIAGQPPLALPNWVVSVVPIVTGYTEAMSIAGIGWEITGYLLCSIALLVCVYRARHTSESSRTYLALVLASYLLLAFKGGFVRHDLHAMMAGTSLMLAAGFVALLLPSRVALVVLAASTLLSLGIDRNYYGTSPVHIADNAKSTFWRAWTGLTIRASDKGRFASEYEKALALLRSQVSIPRLPGTSDIYSYQQAYLFASGNIWNPRPVLQSYSAYTSVLLEANRAHLAGPKGPDNVIFRVETIDGRMPSGEDGASWPVLLSQYRRVAADGAFVYLRRVERAVVGSGQSIPGGSHAFQEQIPVPAGEGFAFAKLDIRPTVAGKLVGTFYKPSAVLIRLDLEDGTYRVYRLIPGMAHTGMLISPLVESTSDFDLLYTDPDQLSGKRVKSFIVAPASNGWQWSPRYGVEFVLRNPPPSD
jgi:hypothetical protein